VAFNGRCDPGKQAQDISQHDAVLPHFGHHKAIAYMTQHYGQQWIGCGGPIPWLPRSSDLLDFLLSGLKKEMVYRTKVQMRWELVCKVMKAVAYTQEHHERIQQTLNSCLN
jgi:hypothetical protein